MASPKFVKIERQPLFVMPTDGVDNFVAWDSGSDKDEALTSTGVTIPSDWDFDSGLSGLPSMNIKAIATGRGKYNTATDSYPEVLIEGVIDVQSVGTSNTTVDLKLLNFLTQVTPS